MSENSYVLHCSWLIRGGHRPLQNQRLMVVDGVLQEVVDVPADEMSFIKPVAILPGLVNAHTHLEFSGLEDPLKPPVPFPEWIRSVVKYRRTELAAEESIQRAVVSGVAESFAMGTSVIGEICTSDSGRAALVNAIGKRQSAGVGAVCFRELLGFTSNRISEQQQVADTFVEQFTQQRSALDNVLPGLSPHAPYSVHPDVVRHAAELSQQHSLPIAMHLAETTDEMEFLELQSGRFVDFLDGIGLWQPESLQGIRGTGDYIEMLQQGALALAVHGNYFNSSDIQRLGKATNITTVYCVRTHRWFGHRNHPWRQIEAAGGAVILGTDSRASNPDLSIWKELQTFCRMNPEQSVLARLPMISTAAAAAIGLDPESVNLNVGTRFSGTVLSTDASSESALDHSLKQNSCQVQPDVGVRFD